MEINKITLNGVEYNITDAEARQITNILSGKIDETQKELAELRECLQWVEPDDIERVFNETYIEDGNK